MAYNEELATRIRSQLELFKEDFTEKRMFGGLAFLYRGKMTIGIIKNDLMVRVLSHKMEHELAKDFNRLMDFTKRPMKEFIYVAPQGVTTERDLLHYIELGLEHARSKF
ncbi:MAG: hypothetical protein HKN00_14250 [Flavobacteriaceae bacterium]|nr:TfoX/Sxy family protein [Bacteroidia bacterium]MBT8287034.1 TfoX/Sxy family protein [Bacteroidia bacterium]NNF76343.1 hypothetical protein [Flavobacteriaceae bacterium]NNK72753.1 hypothetical protein [Flavobacteriaceae bacterium]